MNNEINSFISLDEVTNSAIMELDGGNDQYFKAYQFGLRCLRDLHYSFTGEYVEATVEVLANGTALLPDNFVSEISVGLINGQGEFITLRKNKLITRNDEETCDRNDQATVGSPAIGLSGGYPVGNFSDHNGSRGIVGSLGVGSALDYGSYDIDYNTNLIMFDFRVQTDSYANIVLRYLPMFCIDSEIYMPANFVECVTKCIVYDLIKHKRNISAYDKSTAKADYANERRLLKMRIRTRGISLGQIYDAWRRNLRSSLKY